MNNNEIEYFLENNYIDYPSSISFMEKKVEDIYKNRCKEFLWFLEHEDIYTAGTSSKSKDLLDPNKFKVYKTNRGGQFTYHGPGQRIVYVMLDLRKKGYDIRGFVTLLENWIISSLKTIGISATNDKDHVGIWVKEKNKLNKISSIGLRVRKGITFHGVSININPNLDNFKGINPCGKNSSAVTSIYKLGLDRKIKEFDNILIDNFKKTFKAKLTAKKTLK
ncbi:MAG: lipoyl(octanoyl) transferase LipB [Pseudomonadota bacterium]|nr:lipoyl(octanoyl) transferase LipB [Pseudomonadota bacterium]MEC7830224.1 lipoyl(octanoyl) transferase LipB [Pseudomonadota bacterium]MEC9382741.1 lipoyl(octanoyl) transferase LipB [Pseudomonadota bacterium]